MSDRPKSTPPIPSFFSEEWEEFAAFRGTFLRLFKPEDAAALVRLGRLLYDCALECGREWHRDQGPDSEGELRAIAGDFRFLQGHLEAIGREYLQASLDRKGVRLSQLAEAQAPDAARIAVAIEQALGA